MTEGPKPKPTSFFAATDKDRGGEVDHVKLAIERQRSALWGIGRRDPIQHMPMMSGRSGGKHSGVGYR